MDLKDSKGEYIGVLGGTNETGEIMKLWSQKNKCVSFEKLLLQLNNSLAEQFNTC